MMRPYIVWLHRWAGLTMTIFLVIVGLTGSILAFHEQLDHWLNADLFDVPVKEDPALDVFELRERAEALEPRARVDAFDLKLAEGRSFSVFLSPKTDPATNKLVVPPYNQLFLDPYTGNKIGARNTREVSLDRRGILNFILRLHTSLALPESFMTWGSTLLGIVALTWTIDCFLGFYLTFPLHIHSKHLEGLRRSWWSKWRPAWLIRWNGGPYRLNFDIHRSFGLWTWAMLFVFAWSGVSFNLNSVYLPVMSAVFDMGEMGHEHKPLLKSPLEVPTLSFRDAYVRGRELMAQVAKERGLTVEKEKSMGLSREDGQFGYVVLSSKGWYEAGDTAVLFDADTGAFTRLIHLGDDTTGEAITHWLMFFHMALVFGLPMKIFVCVMGFVVAALSVTGVYIWWKKCAARKFRVEQNRRGEGATPLLTE
jgi:uncharacterized iron-regulated membrane protein